jgi:5'-nucleotidase
MGRPLFWVTVRPIEEVEEHTDRWAIRESLISITPLRLDLTDRDALDGAARPPAPAPV